MQAVSPVRMKESRMAPCGSCEAPEAFPNYVAHPKMKSLKAR
jgi:hypothetical protein